MLRVPARPAGIAAAVTVVAAAAIVSITAAHAATYTVTRFDDPPPGTCEPSDCSLREAVMAANATVGTDSVMLQDQGRYVLTIPSPGEGPLATDASQGDLDVTDPLYLSVAFTGMDGPMRPGAGATIDAGGRFTVGSGISITQPGIADRVFHVTSSLDVSHVTVTGGTSEQGAGLLVDHGTLMMQLGGVIGNASNGQCCGGGISAVQSNVRLVTDVSNNAVANCCGGGIYNESSTVRINGTVSYNDAFGCCGAGIHNWSDPSSGRNASLTIEDSRVAGNDVRDCCGGGIYNEAGGPVSVTITDTRFQDNIASDDCCGGALYSKSSATVTATRTRWNGNSTAGCCGGAIYNEGTLHLERSAVIQNSVSNCCGGGIAGIGGASSTNLTNVTVSSNGAGTEPGQPALPSAGGLYLDSGQMTLTHVTVAHNSGSNGASGVANGDVNAASRGTLTLARSIVANNTGSPQCLGPMTSQGYNIASDASCALTQPTDRPSTDPGLGALFAETHPLASGSPAIDAIPAGQCPPPATDQNGTTRPQDRADAPGTGCDIGAVEMTAPTPATPTPMPTATPTPTPGVTPMPTPGVTPTPTPSVTPTPTPTGSAPPTGSPGATASPTPTPTPTPDPPPIDPRCGNEGVVCGTDGSETITGTEDADLIICGDGDDVVEALGGGDRIECGNEGDTGDKDVDAGAGDDDVTCDGTGDDEVDGGAGNDDVRCGAGNDSITGGKGRDRLFSTTGNDSLRGGAGRDTLGGGGGHDSLFGGTRGDVLSGGHGNDGLLGQRGRDTLRAGPGRDRCDATRGETALGCETRV